MACMEAAPRLHHWRSFGGADTSGIRAFREANQHLRIATGLIIAPAEATMQVSETEWVLPWDTR